MTNNLDMDSSVLGTPFQIGTKTAKNRFVIQPMEGNDGDENGNPTPGTVERYLDLARGGAGLIFIECTAVTPQAKGRGHGLVLTPETAPKFRELAEKVKNSVDNPPVLLIQLNHGGRFSYPLPLIAHHHPLLDARVGLDSGSPTLTAGELWRILELFAGAAALSREAGFDGADFKACHGYLGIELMRPSNDRNDEFGGSETNRMRFFEEGYKKIRAAVGNDWILGSRISLFEGIPGGFGTDPEDSNQIDEKAIKRFLDRINALKPDFINHTAAIPYVNPDLSRPQKGDPDPEGMQAIHRRLISLARSFRPQTTLIASVFSYFGASFPRICAEIIKKSQADAVGLGRQVFADPGFPNKILSGKPESINWCRACPRNQCNTLLKNHLPTGCAVYNSYYREIMKNFLKSLSKNCSRRL